MSLEKIKEYQLKEGVTKGQLFQAGFINGGLNEFVSHIKPPKIFYRCKLLDDISLYIEISLADENHLQLNGPYSVRVLEGDFLETYRPFYHSERSYLYMDTASTNRMNRVIRAYNKRMDKLVERGVLEEVQPKEIEEERPKQYSKTTRPF